MMLLAEIDKNDVWLAVVIFGGVALFITIITVGILIDNGKLRRRSKAVRQAEDATHIAELQFKEQEFRQKTDQLLDRRLNR